MTKEELMNKISTLLEEFEDSNNRDIIGCYLTFSDDKHGSVYQYNGEAFTKETIPLLIGEGE